MSPSMTTKAPSALAAVTAALKQNWFLLGIVAAVAFGFVLAPLGVRLNPGSVTTNAIVVLQFLILGFTLPTESILKGLAGWRLHVAMQATIFVAAPLLFLVASMPLHGILEEGLVVGILAIGVLPTTVSSCVVFTQLSGGNVVGAMFNSALANMAGVFVSPLLLSLFLSSSGRALPPDQLVGVVIDLVVKMVLPVIAGQLVRRFFARYAQAHRKGLGTVANALVLVTVYFAVAKSAGHPAFSHGVGPLLVPAGCLAAIHIALVGFALGLSRVARFGREDTIAMLFAAPQKTLVMGIPMLQIYFAGNPALLGLAVLPLLFYHPFQLLVAGVIRNTVRRGA
jgi:solute carrier family 10 (sodium/bile acid cotransporter), member 7